MAWLYLLGAGIFEVAFASALKLSEGFTRPWPTAAFFVFSLLSFLLLSRAVLVLPIGTAYAVWTGIGAAGTALIGIAFLGESMNAMRLFFIATLVASIIGLKLASNA